MKKLIQILMVALALLLCGGCKINPETVAAKFAKRTYEDCKEIKRVSTIHGSAEATVEVKCLKKTYIIHCSANMCDPGECKIITWFPKD